MSNTHVMIDIETLGTRTSSIVLSIAAVRFRMDTGEIIGSFQCYPNLDEQEKAGRTLSAATLYWHLQDPSRAHILAATCNPETQGKSCNETLTDLCQFLLPSDLEKDLYWCLGASFDFPILKSLFQQFKVNYWREDFNLPFTHRQEMCMRPILAASPESKKRTPDVGTSHEAMSDCLYQINLLRNCLEDLNLLSRFCGGNEEGK